MRCVVNVHAMTQQQCVPLTHTRVTHILLSVYSMHVHTALRQEGVTQGTTRPLFKSDAPTEGLMTSEYKAAYVAPFSPQKNTPSFTQNVAGTGTTTGDGRPWQVRNCQMSN